MFRGKLHNSVMSKMALCHRSSDGTLCNLEEVFLIKNVEMVSYLFMKTC